MIKSSCVKHVLRSQDFSPEYLDKLFSHARKLMARMKSSYSRESLVLPLRDRVVTLLFYQPSTRTRFSFEQAARLLGAHTFVTENAGEFSSAIKGETLEHTIRNFGEMHADAIVLRHPENDAAERAAAIVDQYYPYCHIINGGNGTGQHPTQSFIDLFTIEEHLGRLNNFTIAMCGDLAHSRTTHSLAYLLSKYANVKMIFYAPGDKMEMKKEILDHLDEHGIQYMKTSFLSYALRRADAVYVTRAQKEAHGKDIEGETYFKITPKEMELLKPHAVLTHPLPIAAEISREVDSDPRSHYFKAVGYGLCIRMALLEDLIIN